MQDFFRVDGLFYRVLNKIWGLMVLNLLILITSLPLITIGAVQTASFTVLSKMIREGETKIISTYWQSFKKNFKQSTFAWLILALIIYILAIDWVYFIQFNQLGNWFAAGALIVTILIANIWQFLFYYLSRFDDTLKIALINIVKISFSRPLISLLSLIIMLGPVLLMFLSSYLFVFSLFISIFIGLSFNLFLRTYLMLAIFTKYEN
ncbi:MULTISPECIES: YesL family protein [unclassified Enterococcus]|uniref:YesL family protein n=1 Tax=unclassified Enterococcus TaxID=2608891 RepID=UPI001553E76D|nr:MULTISPECIES: YesL family protein [unclassified Enterococcus]MBS7577945.1 YesL family protein [Enterococcus sp. MMGLQ5-2]MBS7585194.1 YesL family protein [Enterococcus sp. MMGLQ5-1]NPD13051.1 YesL family protein [Enterococcus sp. MMGLQ5-1]NPD37775.1 YesL family protein [Enterococcus sp. MMGLQ5-2]